MPEPVPDWEIPITLWLQSQGDWLIIPLNLLTDLSHLTQSLIDLVCRDLVCCENVIDLTPLSPFRRTGVRLL